MSSPKSAEINKEMQEDDVPLRKQEEEKEEHSASCSSSSVDQQSSNQLNPNQEIPTLQNLDQETPISQNPNQEIPFPQNLDQEIRNPQNPDQEITNPHNPVQEIQNPQNPFEKTRNPENPRQEESKWRKEANKIIKMNSELRKLQLERGKRGNRPQRRRQGVTRFAPMQPIPEDDDDEDGFCSEGSDTFEEMEPMAAFVASKAKEEANQGQKEDCILLERSTSEEYDDITTMNYFEAYIRDPITSLEISTSEENLNTLYKVILSRGEDIKLEILEQKVIKLRKKYSMLRDRINTDPGAIWTMMPYEVKILRLGQEVWGSNMLEETRRFGIRDQENATIPTSIDAPSSSIDDKMRKYNEELGARNREFEKAKLLPMILLESYHVRNKSELSQLMQHLQFEGNEKGKQQEVEAGLHRSYGQKGDEWAKEYKKVEEMQMADELVKPDKKYQHENEELCKRKSAILFEDDWEVAEECILFKRSKSEEEDDIITLKCVIAYKKRKIGEVSDNIGALYGFISSRYGVDITSLEVLEKKLAKLLHKYLMILERIRLDLPTTLMTYDHILHRFGTEVWGSRMLEGNLPLLDSKGIGITDQQNAPIAYLRASARSRQRRQFRICQDPTIGLRRRIRPSPTSSFPNSADEAFDSLSALNPNRGLVIRDAEKLADDPPREAVPDLKAKGKRQAERGAPNQRPRKSQRLQELLLLFEVAETEEEDDILLLRYASAYGRNVTSPTVAGLYEFILANLLTGESISWFLLKLKMTMLERRYLTMLGVLDSNGNKEAYHTEYHRELYRLGRLFWGDETEDQSPDGNMGTRGASGGASGSGGANEGADVGASQGGNGGAN